MNTKSNNRTIVKSDTTENWAKAVNFVPLKGEPIIYWDDNGIKMKIGDGENSVNNLPFAFQEKKSAVNDEILIL